MKHLVLLLMVLISFSISIAAQKKSTPVRKPLPSKTKTITKPSADPVTAIKDAFQAKDYNKALVLADKELAKKPGDELMMGIKALSYGMMYNKEMVKKTIGEMFPHSQDTAAINLASFPGNLPKEISSVDGPWYIAESKKMNPGSAVPYLMESAFYIDDSMTDQARQSALAGLSLLKETDGVGMYIQYTRVLLSSGATEQSAALLNKLVKAHPEDTAVVKEHYSALLHDKNYKEALAELDHLMRLQPDNNIHIRKERAFLYKDMGRDADACNEAAALTKEDDSYFLLQCKLGCPDAFANLKPASVKSYIYNVDYHSMKYKFIVKPKSIRMNEGLSFDWSMTIRDEMKGAIIISKAALDTAHSQMNKFVAGDATLNDLTTVWVSNAVFHDLKTKGHSLISASDAGSKMFSVITDNESEPTILNAAGQKKALKTIHVKSDDGEEELWINDDEANPLITHMSIGWSIELASVE